MTAAEKSPAREPRAGERRMGVAGFRSVALAVAWRSTHNFFTNPSLVGPALAFPLFFFTAFAGGLSAVSEIPAFDFPSGYTAFQYVFVILQASALGGVFAGFGIARDFETGIGRRLMLAATNRSGIIAGYAGAAAIRAVTIWVVLTAVAFAVGMEIGGGVVDLFGLFVIAGSINLIALLWACGVAMRLRTIQAGPVMQLPVFIILFLAPVYVPLDLLSGWIHAVASVNPATAFLEAGRSLIAGSPEALGLVALLVAVIAPCFLLWARGGLRSAERAGG